MSGSDVRARSVDFYDTLPAPDGGLLHARRYEVSRDECDRVLRDLSFLRDAGLLRLPKKIVVRFRFAPGKARGTAACENGEYSIYLNAAEIFDEDALRAVTLHEAVHIEQMFTGEWHRLSRAERERAADQFVERMLGL